MAQSPPTHFHVCLCSLPTEEFAMIQSTTIDDIPDEILATSLIFLGAQDADRSVQAFHVSYFTEVYQRRRSSRRSSVQFHIPIYLHVSNARGLMHMLLKAPYFSHGGHAEFVLLQNFHCLLWGPCRGFNLQLIDAKICHLAIDPYRDLITTLEISGPMW